MSIDIKEPVYLTNATCDDAQSVKSGFSGKYPLTRRESQYIADDVAQVADGFGALMGYSAMYQDKKYLMPSIELFYGKGTLLADDEALEFGEAFVEAIKGDVEAIGGHVFLRPDDMPKRHLIQVLIPFEHAFSKADKYDDWKKYLETDLLSCDLKVGAVKQFGM